MNQLEDLPAETRGADESECKAVVQRLAASASLRKAHRLRDFLLFVTERAFANRPEELTEHSIGVHVFGRPPHYTPAEDNIVRVSARQLRTKIQEYFSGEGLNEPWIIEIPKGTYVPTFCRKEFAVEAPAAGPAVIPAGMGPDRKMAFALWLATFAIAALSLACVVLWRQNAALGAMQEKQDAPRTIVGDAVLTYGGDTKIVLTDSALVLMNSLAAKTVSVSDYASRDFVVQGASLMTTPREKWLWTLLSTRQITSLADVGMLIRLFQTEGSSRHRIFVHHASHVTVRDFKNNNFVIIGSPASTPWASLFETSLNFYFDAKPESQGTALLNRNPQRGEKLRYDNRVESGQVVAAPARIALLPNLAGTGRVMLIAGTNMESTEAAGEFASDPSALKTALSRFGVKSLSELHSFEILLDTSPLAGTTRSKQVVASRVQRSPIRVEP